MRGKPKKQEGTEDTDKKTADHDVDSNLSDNNNTKRPVLLQRMDTKVSMFAPEANDTDFNDVPVVTICPHCRLKVVTKTSYGKSKPCL